METNTTHWSDDNGRITCSAHAGNYLTSAIQAKPKTKKHRTPIGTWEKLDSLEVAMFMAEFGYCCETCRYEAK
jgi:hypothetical protein